MTTPPVVLTVAGTDSGGAAGIAADLATFAALGVPRRLRRHGRHGAGHHRRPRRAPGAAATWSTPSSTPCSTTCPVAVGEDRDARHRRGRRAGRRPAARATCRWWSTRCWSPPAAPSWAARQVVGAYVERLLPRRHGGHPQPRRGQRARSARRDPRRPGRASWPTSARRSCSPAARSPAHGDLHRLGRRAAATAGAAVASGRRDHQRPRHRLHVQRRPAPSQLAPTASRPRPRRRSRRGRRVHRRQLTRSSQTWSLGRGRGPIAHIAPTRRRDLMTVHEAHTRILATTGDVGRARSPGSPSPTARRSTATAPRAPAPTPRSGCRRCARPGSRDRGDTETYAGRETQLLDNGRAAVRRGEAQRASGAATKRARAAAQPGAQRHPAALRPRGHRHPGDGVRRRPRGLRRRAASAARSPPAGRSSRPTSTTPRPSR